MSARQPLSGPSVWTGTEMLSDRRWLFPLSPAAVSAIDTALANVTGVPWEGISKDSFNLGTVADDLAAMADELENGCGIVKLTGLPVDRYTLDDVRRLYVGIASHLGTLVGQNGARGLMRDIRDSSATGGKRVDSADALRWHNDRADVVGLLCVRRANRGGVSRIVSIPAIHNEILRRRPDLVDILFDDFYRYSPGDDVGAARAAYPLPVFGLRDGYFTSHYSRTYIEQAQSVETVAPLTRAQIEALDMLETLAEELCFEMTLDPGDIQFLNNHILYHGRTNFEDDAAKGASRLLLRLWLAMPNSRPLPANHAVLWGNVEAGSVRGGFGERTA